MHDCNRVLRIETNNVKALLRRATAFQELGRPSDAERDLVDLLKLEEWNNSASKLLDQVRKDIAERHEIKLAGVIIHQKFHRSSTEVADFLAKLLDLFCHSMTCLSR